LLPTLKRAAINLMKIRLEHLVREALTEIEIALIASPRARERSPCPLSPQKSKNTRTY
jgi:hypothetical protein